MEVKVKKIQIIIIVSLILAVGLVSWGFHSKKSLDNIKQHATLVKAEVQDEMTIMGRYPL